MFEGLHSSFEGHIFYVKPSFLKNIQPPLNIKNPSSKNFLVTSPSPLQTILFNCTFFFSGNFKVKEN